MVTQAANNVELVDGVSSDRFEKMVRRTDWRMPSNKSRAARSASVRTPGSKRVARHVSRQSGGAHRRRRKVWR